ncbi:MAG: hypothetical protein RR394_09965 [Oscillospiraceae bacterium]
MTAGELDTKLSVLQLLKTENCWAFNPFHQTFGHVEIKNTRNIFSTTAMSARTVEVTVRRQAITLRDSLLWGDKQLFISAIDDSKKHLLTITAAEIAPVTVLRKIERYGKNEMNNPIRLAPVEQTFPAWISEKYVKLEKDKPAANIETVFVLIVPKAVDVLAVGDLIVFGGAAYAVEICHLLDPNKNEYEIVFRGDA